MNEAIQNLINSGRIEKGMYWQKAWSLVSGCSPVSEGCCNCWSATQAHIRSHQKNPKMQAQYGEVTTSDGKWNGKIKLLEQNLELPLKRKKPTVWAIWNDLMLAPTEFIDQVLEVVAACPQHIIILCTKRPELLEAKLYGGAVLGGGDFLRNLWLMTTAENQAMANKRIPELLKMYAFPVKGVSVEPMLERITLNKNWLPGYQYHPTEFKISPALNWVVCGTENLGGRPGRHVPIEAVIGLRNQCIEAGVPFFLKQRPMFGKKYGLNTMLLVKMPPLDGKIYDQLPGRI